MVGRTWRDSSSHRNASFSYRIPLVRSSSKSAGRRLPNGPRREPSCKPPRQPARRSRAVAPEGVSTPADTNPTASLTKQHGYRGSLVAFSFQKQHFLLDVHVGAKHHRRVVETQGLARKSSHMAKRNVEWNQNGTPRFRMWA